MLFHFVEEVVSTFWQSAQFWTAGNPYLFDAHAIFLGPTILVRIETGRVVDTMVWQHELTQPIVQPMAPKELKSPRKTVQNCCCVSCFCSIRFFPRVESFTLRIFSKKFLIGNLSVWDVSA